MAKEDLMRKAWKEGGAAKGYGEDWLKREMAKWGEAQKAEKAAAKFAFEKAEKKLPWYEAAAKEVANGTKTEEVLAQELAEKVVAEQAAVEAALRER